jgi:hypothetical protein
MVQQHVTRDGAMKSEDVADAIVFVVSLPPRANVSPLRIRPTRDVASFRRAAAAPTHARDDYEPRTGGAFRC